MILDGKLVSKKIIDELKEKINKIDEIITLAIIQIGNNEASNVYIKNKVKMCNYVGINTKVIKYDKISENELLKIIDELNENEEIKGIILQSPVPDNININKCFDRIRIDKDIDGLSSFNLGKLYTNQDCYIPCTAKGIMELLKFYNIELENKNVCIINRSNIIGLPLFYLMNKNNANVTICHSKTKDISLHTKNADIIISAVGIPNFIKCDIIKNDCILIDVGFSKVNGKIVGDIDFNSVKEKAKYITPNPGGVGPMTIAMVIDNLVRGVLK